jgi:hypothetical protein
MMPLYISVVIGLVCFILYALDRKSVGEPIDYMIAGKLSILGSAISGGIAYALTSPESITEIAKAVVEVPAVQEMFVGSPTF